MINSNWNTKVFLALMWTIVMVSLLSIVWAEPQSKDYLPPKHGTAPATAHHLPAGGARPGGKDDGPNEPANYDFSYEVQDPSNSLDFGHSEKRVADQTSGSYHVLLPDGRVQIVDYEAGLDGYRPQVRYEGQVSAGGGGGGGGGRKGGEGGYNYNAASNQQPVRQPAPKATPSPVSKTT